MKRLVLHIAFIFSISIGFAQINLVPNPSFEEKDSCPSFSMQLDPVCKNWFTPIAAMSTLPTPFSLYGWGSSDYYHTCSTIPNFSIPSNNYGYQHPFSGLAYVGFGLFANDLQMRPYKEYIEVELKQSLIKDCLYLFEMYYSVSGDFYFELDPTLYFPLRIEALLTDTILYRHIDTTAIDNVKTIVTTATISSYLPLNIDTTSWIKVSDTFRAKGGERYLTIGNFRDYSAFTDLKFIYLYLDNVALTYVGGDTTPPAEQVHLYPNPARESVWLEQRYGSLQGVEIELWDMTGRRVYRKQISADVESLELPLYHLASGMYLYAVRKEEQMLDTGKLVLLK